MAKNVMKLLKPSPNFGKNGFDLSHRKLIDVRMGELLPCCTIETVPDDDITINVSDLLRAMPLITSPFMRVKQHIDFWFVPYNCLWHQFNAFISSRDEPASSVLKDSQYCPHVNLRSLKTAVHANAALSVHGSNAQFEDNAWKLLDLLGYPTYNYVFGDPADIPTIEDNVDVNLFRLAAYQYIWYHEYRQKYYDPGTLGGGINVSTPAIASMFNFDFCRCDTYAHADILSEAANAFSATTYASDWSSMGCQLRYRCWKKDLWTGLLPSTQLGAVSTVGTMPDNIIITSKLGTTGTLSVNSSGNLLNNTTFEWKLNDAISPFGKAGSLDILSLRSAQALQIWRENALRAGNQIDDNFMAHYGVKPGSHMFEHPHAIGSIDAPLNISDVMATADTGMGTGNDAVGDIAGKGISSMDGSKTLRFKTNDFGVVMGIFSLLPESEYNQSGIDRPNQLIERFDFYSKEMENLGLEAVDSRTFSCDPQPFIPGYAPRYFGYKTILDKAHHYFMNMGASHFVQGPYRAWASPKYDMFSSNTALRLSSLYVNPAIFNVNFVSNNDQMLLDIYNQVKAVRIMSVTGMPSK